MTGPINEPLVTVPYVGVDEFRNAPTWLDSNDLVEGGIQAAQDSELYNVLIRASCWAVEYCGQTLHAHVVPMENDRVRIDRLGRVKLHPRNFPVRSITGIAFGPDPALMNVLSNANQPLTELNSNSVVWVEDQRGLVVGLLPMNGAFLGNLQFGTPANPGGLVYVSYSYVAGYANTYLTASSTNNSPNLTVADPTGFIPPATNIFGNLSGGSIARIWDAGLEEAVSVSQSYAQGANPVVLSANPVNAHTATGAPKFGPQVSEMPSSIRQAVISYAVALLMREDAIDDMPFEGSPGPTARRADSRGYGGGLISEAERLLGPHRRTR